VVEAVLKLVSYCPLGKQRCPTLADMLRITSLPSTGTIHSMVMGCAGKLIETVENIRQAIISSALNHFDETGVFPYFSGIAVHDCWKPYWRYGGIRHAVCCAHLLRELAGVMESHPDQTWPKEKPPANMESTHL